MRTSYRDFVLSFVQTRAWCDVPLCLSFIRRVESEGSL